MHETPSDPNPATPAGAGPDEANGNGVARTGYTVRLDQFEGPLDLLLYLIQRDEIDVYDIPIAHITQQYLQSIEQLEVFELDNAGEFLVMASTLMRIKARMLLPVQRPGDDDDDEGDPRDELVRRLLEYKKYKEAARALSSKSTERAEFFRRGQDYPFLDQAEEEAPELSLSLYDLLRAVGNVLEEMRGENVHHVYTDVYTVEGQEHHIVGRVEREERVLFGDLFGNMQVKMEVVVTFIALLDLLKTRRVRAYQGETYGDIWLEAGDGVTEETEDVAGVSSATEDTDSQPAVMEAEAGTVEAAPPDDGVEAEAAADHEETESPTADADDDEDDPHAT